MRITNYLIGLVAAMGLSVGLFSVGSTLGPLLRNYCLSTSPVAASPSSGSETSAQASDASPKTPAWSRCAADTGFNLLLTTLYGTGLVLLGTVFYKSIRQGGRIVILPFKYLNIADETRHTDGSTQTQPSADTPPTGEATHAIGEAIAHQLIADLYRIQEIYEIAKQPIEQSQLESNIPDTETVVDASVSKSLKDLDLPQIQPCTGDLSEAIGEISTEINTVGSVSGRISINQLPTFLHWLNPFSSTGMITGSLQNDGTHLKMTAHLQKGKQFRAWDVSSTLDPSQGDWHHPLSKMVKELAVKIANDLSSNPLTLKGFQDFTDTLDRYNHYKQTWNVEDLSASIRAINQFCNEHPNYIYSFGFLYNLGIAAFFNNFRPNGTNESEQLFRHAIALEPCITQLSRKKCIHAQTQTAIGRESQHWLEGLSYVLNGLGQTLEEDASDARDIDIDKKQVKLKEAIEAYERAAKLAKSDALSLSHLGALRIEHINLLCQADYLKEVELRKAERDLKKAIKLKKNEHFAYNRLGNLYRNQGDYRAAIDCYQKAIRAYSKESKRVGRSFVVPYRNLGITYTEMLQFEDAIASFDQGIKSLYDNELFGEDINFKQWHAWLHNGKGWTYLMRAMQHPHQAIDLTRAEQEFRESQMLFEQARDQGQAKTYVPWHVPCFNLGAVYAFQGRSRDAIHQWNQAYKACQGNKGKPACELLLTLYRLIPQLAENGTPVLSFGNLQTSLTELNTLLQYPEPHWRIRFGALQDARLLATCLGLERFQRHNPIQCWDIQATQHNMNQIIQTLEDSLPSFYLGLAYVWRQECDQTIQRWRRKVKRLEQEEANHSENAYDDEMLRFRNQLWKSIYQGLIIILSDYLDHQRSTQHSMHERLSPPLTGAQVSSTVLFGHCKVHSTDFGEQTVESAIAYRAEYRLPSLMEESDRLDASIQAIRKTLEEHQPNLDQFADILKDIAVKVDILRHGPTPFCDLCSERLEALFEPLTTWPFVIL